MRSLGQALAPSAASDAYRSGTATGYVMAVIGSQLVGPTDRGDEMFVAMATRHGQHMIDVGLLDHLR